MTVLSFILGLAALVAGADLLVRGSSRLAALAGLSQLVIGLTVVAYGTSAPELAVSVHAAFTGRHDVAVSNIVGSNIFNALFILGLCALLAPLAVNLQLVRIDVPIMIGASVLIWCMSLNDLLGRVDGVFLVALLVAYTWGLIHYTRRTEPNSGEPLSDALGPPRPRGPARVALPILAVLAGVALLVVGARLFVSGAVALAARLGVSDVVIGLTLVAVGTSLPELATSLMATLRGQRDIAVGNVVGSNLFNILGILGVSALVPSAGLPVSRGLLELDIPIMVAVSVFCLPIFVTGTLISRFEGGLLVLYYAGYATLVVLQALGNPFSGILHETFLYTLLPSTALVLLISLRASHRQLNLVLEGLSNDLLAVAGESVKQTKKLVILATGGTLLVVGAAMLILPGPGVVVLLLGLSVLGSEFVWAKNLLNRTYRDVRQLVERARKLL